MIKIDLSITSKSKTTRIIYWIYFHLKHAIALDTTCHVWQKQKIKSNKLLLIMALEINCILGILGGVGTKKINCILGILGRVGTNICRILLNQILIVITFCRFIWYQRELCLLRNQSERCNYNPNLVWYIFICMCVCVTNCYFFSRTSGIIFWVSPSSSFLIQRWIAFL